MSASGTYEGLTLARNCAIQCVTLDKEGFAGASAMSFEDIDGFYRIFGFTPRVNGLDCEHSIDSHGCEQVIIPTNG